ncbi:hypothetical protein ACJRO7_023413 [Eucalyptus globulus]|uniref:Uncharacterized protein n=1 Tax=Eucalyptus globulus TaxID=34317 RepID=A0ABD3K495_EUCGL
MKRLIRRLSRVADSSQYSLLRSESKAARRPRKAESFRVAVASTTNMRRSGAAAAGAAVPEGHVPVYVGEEMERFVVIAEMLNHPVFIGLLNRSAQEYGYEQQGALRIPCHVVVFERLLECLRLGHDSQDLISALSLDDSCF